MIAFDPIAYINTPRWQESRLGLSRIRELLDRMGRPQDRLRFVHVAGTNGKGSVCAYLASILQTAGLRTGLFTSPYIIEFSERIRVNGENISAQDLREVTLFVREHAEAMDRESGEHPTEFELMTAVAFEHFARQHCDIVVCEVGLGGRLDSTNVIDAPEACVITRIGLDHTDLLGETLVEIAREKAGIVKPGAALVSWPQDDKAAMQAIEDAAQKAARAHDALNASSCAHVFCVHLPDFSQLEIAPVEGALRPFIYRGVPYTTRLLGSYQPANAALAIETAQILRKRGWHISDEAIAQGIALASWPGRFELLITEPVPFIVDGGHNPQGAAALADSLRDVFPGKKAVFVMSVLADKDYRAMIYEVAPLAQAFICTTPPNPRALPATELAAAIRECTGEAIDAPVPVFEADDFEQALKRARQLASPDGIVCAFGSLYSISEIDVARLRSLPTKDSSLRSE